MSAAEVLPALGRLVDKSLVVADVRADESRYRLLETIRAFAAARLVEAEEDTALRERHLAWFLLFVEAAEADREPDVDGWRRALALEYDNLRAALDWGLAAEDPGRAGNWRRHWPGCGTWTGAAGRASASCTGRSTACRTNAPACRPVS
ncbi:hypothetical protein [Dactylosporangium cerinum]